jgi:hypothetical protein
MMNGMAAIKMKVKTAAAKDTISKVWSNFGWRTLFKENTVSSTEASIKEIQRHRSPPYTKNLIKQFDLELIFEVQNTEVKKYQSPPIKMETIEKDKFGIIAFVYPASWNGSGASSLPNRVPNSDC